MTFRSDSYYTEKYSLTATHSEVVNAAGIVVPGDALDLGCGRGRNALYLNLKGFNVTAWDKNPMSIASLNDVIAQEGLQHISAAERDVNVQALEGSYDFILSTVVLMFLNRARIPSLLGEMQGATRPGGYNLIVSAMDTPDYPCTVDFPFTFAPDELRDYYRGWEMIKYNEDVGELHRTDASGRRIQLRFATLLARKPA